MDNIKKASKPKQKKSATSQALEAIQSGKPESKANKLLSLIPEGHSPAVYLDLIKTQVLGVDRAGKVRSDEDLMLFLYTCKRTGLDPLVNQIYAVFRWDSRLGKEKMTIQTGIDGMRLVAQRTGEYAGQDDASYLPEDESSQVPIKATVTVYKLMASARVPFTATARWAEYIQLDKQGKPTGLWSKMPYLMLAKCAEALALRKAFPNELSGIYAREEMGQADNSILGDLPTPDKFNKAPDVPQVDHGAPDDDNRPTIHIGDEGAAKASDELKAKAEMDAEANKTNEVAVDKMPEPQKVARKVEAMADLAAQRKALKDKKKNGSSK
jgi:phage recombination protein Bet